MSTTVEHETHTGDDVAHDAHDDHEHGLSDMGYVKVALLLGVLTAIEVSTYYLDFGPLFMPTLIVLMVVKFFIVVSYFMHLKFDNKLFTWMFYAGVFLAIGVYVGALATFEFFISG